MTANADPVASVAATTVVLPLPAPLRLGSTVITQREYAVVRVRTEAGLEGCAFALTRDLPLAEAIRRLGPQLVGRDSELVADAWEHLFRSTVVGGRSGIVVRAIALLDVALWDIKGKRAGLPVWSLLGGLRREVPVLMVGGYPVGTTSPDALVERVLAYAQAGYRLVKLARSPDPAVTASILESVLAKLPDDSRLIVDAAWCWRSARDALVELASWGETRIAWLEDPLVPEDVAACAQLRSHSPVPLGFGDEVASPHLLHTLVREGAVDVLRIDATTVGFTGAMRVAAVADAAGVPVSPHVYPDTNVHLAAALPGCVGVETFDPADPSAEPSGLLVRGTLRLDGPFAAVPSAPGLGFELADDALERYRID